MQIKCAIYLLFFIAFLNIVQAQEAEINTGGSTICYKHGQAFPLGSFQDPEDVCKACQCCSTGVYTCVRKMCPKLYCGIDKQQKTADGCCNECKPECDGAVCPSLGNCPSSRHAYPADSCCPVCGCERFRQAVLPGNYGHPCSYCQCNATTNETSCNIVCPPYKPRCVDPEFDDDCNLFCPNNRTCRRYDKIIKYGEVVLIGHKFCTCGGDWYPRAFCANAEPAGEKIRRLKYALCVKRPTVPQSVNI